MEYKSQAELSDIIRAEKSNIRIGNWEEGAVPRSKFPINRSKLSLGRGWEWRTVTFQALGEDFVVLIALSAEKESYRATLAMKSEKSLKVICCHELHTDHWNWHCHFIKGNVYNTFTGVLRDRNLMRAWPHFSRKECSVPFNVSEENALTLAAKRFRFAQGGGFI